ncbi:MULTISPECIES: hypothetical protein [unclassified Nitrospina]|uniref:hypothetical protein n=1 Tax=unclassified Nitrospina TaxID=2638683 RepID=UPI003F9740E4
MFWESVFGGLKILTYWETYVAGLEYLLIIFLPLLLVTLIMEKNEGVGGAIGCLTMIFLPILQVFAVAVFILTLAPIIFGFSDDVIWSFPWKVINLATWPFIKFIGILIIVSIVFAMIPLIGRIQSLHTLVIGGVALIYVLGLYQNIYPSLVNGPLVFFPGIWFLIGLLVLGVILGWVGIMVVAALVMVVMKGEENGMEIVMFPIGAIFGFIPVFIYGAWLGAQVKGLLN